LSKSKTTKKNPRKIRNQSVSNKISSTVITLSKAAGFGLSLSPGSFRGLRSGRGKALSLQKAGRDINALAKGKVGARINNRVKGRLGGLAVNAILPNTNNVVLRLARAQIGSYLNKAIHKKTKRFNVLEVFGSKATIKAHKEIFDMESGSLFIQMQNQLAFSLRALAPRTEFSMNSGGTRVDFSPDNLSESVMIHPVQRNPEENVIAKWAVSVGGNNPEGPADKAPYVWIANYGGMMFNPLDPTKNKPYGPTFFAERSLEFIERTYKPVIKKMYEVFTPQSVLDEIAAKNMKMDPSKFVSRSYSQTHKRLQKIWLSKDGEALEKQIEMQKANKGGKTVSTSYSSREAGNQDFMEYYQKHFGVKEYDKTGRMFQDAQEDGAMAAMRIMYGDEYYEKITEKEVLRKTKPTNKRRTRVKEQTVEKIPYAITTGTGRVPIYADMRELKNVNGKWKAGRGANSHYKNTVLEPSKVSIQKDYRFDLGEVVMTDTVKTKLQKMQREGTIRSVRDTKTGKYEIEVLDVDKFVKELEIESIGRGAVGDPNYLSRGEDATDVINQTLKAKGQGGYATGSKVSGSGARGQTVIATSAQDAARVQAEVDAVKAIVNEVNKQLPYTYVNNKTTVAGAGRRATGKSNREHLHTLTNANEKRAFRRQLNATGQRLNDPHIAYMEAQTKTVRTRKGFFEVKIDGEGRATVVSNTDKQIISKQRNVQKLETRLSKAEDKVRAEANRLDDLVKPANTDKIDVRAATKRLKQQGYVKPTDSEVDQIFWKVGKHKANADTYIDGFGPLKKGEAIPVLPQPQMKIADLTGEKTISKTALSTTKLKKLEKERKSISSDLRSEKKTLNNLFKERAKEQSIFSSQGGGVVAIQGKRFGTGRGAQAKKAGINAVEEYNKNKLPSIFKGVNVSGTSGVIASRGNIVNKDMIQSDTFQAIASADDQGQALPTLSFFFKTDISKDRAQELGLFAYTAKVHKPKLGGGHSNRGRTIKPIVNRRKNGAVDLVYKDPQLPTAQLVLRQRFTKQGSKTTVRYEDQSGSKITPVTSRRTADDVSTASLLEDLMFLESGINNEKIEKPRNRATGGFKQSYANDGSIVLRFEDR
tara:strand:- start:18553 stop:21849 length:3297 start_codon:yes stop_codon:yes gene_type:complete